MLIRTIPSQYLAEICQNWKEGDSIQSLVGGQLFGKIEFSQINTKEDGYLRTSEDRNILADCALMMWLAEQSKENFTVGLQWAGDYHCGALALSNGKFTEFIVPTDTIMEFQKQLCLMDEFNKNEIKDLRDQGKTEQEIEDFISECSDDFRVEARDTLQEDFLKAIHDNLNLADLNYFKILSNLGCKWEVNQLPEMSKNAKQLLQPINYNDLNIVEQTFKCTENEHWKQHRDRVHSTLGQLPKEFKNNHEIFKKIIPHVASWVLQYSGPSVRSDKEIIMLAIKADKKHNYAPECLTYAEPEIFNDKIFLKKVLKEQPEEFRNLPEKLKKDESLLQLKKDSELIRELDNIMDDLQKKFDDINKGND